MVNPKTNYLIDILMGILFAIVAVTGGVLFFFPSGIKQGSYQAFFGIAKGTWLSIHNLGGIALIIMVLIHFIIHWKWFIYTTKMLLKRK